MEDDYETLLGLRLTGGVEIDPDVAYAQFPHNTMRLGHAQASLVEIPGQPDELYLFNIITDPAWRLRGQASALLDRLMEMADENQVTLCTHPDQDWVRDWLLEPRGFRVNDERPAWEGKPFMSRRPTSSPLPASSAGE